tara:strand:- start:31024 stop:31233 length:210 start_codon:yes stop_codon:yes gene_type:complete
MQTKLYSFIESCTNIVVGFIINVIANILVLPLFGFYPSLLEASGMGIIFTIISLLRSYFLRRLFNRMEK